MVKLLFFSLFNLILFSANTAVDPSPKVSSYKSNAKNQTLFVIERNKNANTVFYDVNITQNGKIDSEKPVDAYFVDYATTGKRAELSFIERKMAYGFEFEKTENNNFYVTLRAYKDRKILVYLDAKGNAHSLMKINGKTSQLTKIFVFAKPKLYTSVEFIELHGVDFKTGDVTYEKIINK